MTKICQAVLIETQMGVLYNFHFYFRWIWETLMGAVGWLVGMGIEGGGGGFFCGPQHQRQWELSMDRAAGQKQACGSVMETVRREQPAQRETQRACVCVYVVVHACMCMCLCAIEHMWVTHSHWHTHVHKQRGSLQSFWYVNLSISERDETKEAPTAAPTTTGL